MSNLRPSAVVLVLVIVAAIVSVTTTRAQEKAVAIPPPAVDEAASQADSEVAVFAGGCFWGVQGVYQHVKGVTSAISGYAGGAKNTAHYDTVSGGRSGHAESVKVTFDPRVISYGRILQVFFSVVHDPTTLNRQGPDVGPQYRSAIFPASDAQARVAKAYIAQLDLARVFPRPIVTTLEFDRPFFEAERYHQDYLTTHAATDPYIMYNDLPKIAELKRVFPELYRANPALVGSR
jgi:peptide-methionine (S)-S-oxide reductase